MTLGEISFRATVPVSATSRWSCAAHLNEQDPGGDQAYG